MDAMGNEPPMKRPVPPDISKPKIDTNILNTHLAAPGPEQTLSPKDVNAVPPQAPIDLRMAFANALIGFTQMAQVNPVHGTMLLTIAAAIKATKDIELGIRMGRWAEKMGLIGDPDAAPKKDKKKKRKKKR